MSLFGNQSTEGHEENEDRIGGGNFGAASTDIYLAKIKLAYAGKSTKSQAMSVTYHLELPGGKVVQETQWVTSGEGKNYYFDKEDKTKKRSLPGWIQVDNLFMAATGGTVTLQSAQAEEKTIKIYNFETKKEEPVAAQVFTELLGKEVLVAIQEVWENKKEQKGNEYVPIAAFYKTNALVNAMDPGSKLTVNEAKKNLPSTWHDAWLEKNRGNVYDKRTIKENGAASSGKASAPTADSAPRTSLFGNK